MVSKVFIALKTNFFGKPDEHITLAYYNKIGWKDLNYNAHFLQRFVPTEVQLNGFANWVSPGNMHHEVALVNAFENPLLYKNVRTPHITLNISNKPLGNATFIPELFGQKEIIEHIHVGKKIGGKLIWFPVENEPIMETAQRSWEALGVI